MRVLLVGNPNCGKTAVFNRLSHSHNHVGNHPGVTVCAAYAVRGNVTFVDSPGVYSLTPYSLEEKVTKNLVDGENYDVILNIVDATNLTRNLALTLDLINLGLPVLVAVNFCDRLSKNDASIDFSVLSRLLGVTVIPVSAKTGLGFSALEKAFNSSKVRKGACDLPPEEIVKRVLRGKIRDREKSEKIDKILLNPFLCYPILVSVILAMLVLVFGKFGQALSGFCEGAVMALKTPVLNVMQTAPNWVKSLVSDAIIGGVGGVVSFLPQIALLFLILSLLEDSGYMSRAAFLTDALLKRIGLSGRALFPMIMGFGCTTTAVMSAVACQNSEEKKSSILLLPFISCSAKLPVYSLFCSLFFPKYGGLLIAMIYLIGFSAVAVWGLIFKKRSETSFLMEMPHYRIPSLRDTATHVFERCRAFLAKAATVIFLSNVVLWLLLNLPFGNGAQIFGKAVAPVFIPLGFGFWQAALALICGAGAKESIVSTFLVLFSQKEMLTRFFTPASAVSFMIFVLLSPPCLSAIASIKNETASVKFTSLAVFIEFITAYIISFSAYVILS